MFDPLASQAVAGTSAAATTTTMTWTNPGGSNKKRQQISGPSAEELERRVRQKGEHARSRAYLYPAHEDERV